MDKVELSWSGYIPSNGEETTEFKNFIEQEIQPNLWLTKRKKDALEILPEARKATITILLEIK